MTSAGIIERKAALRRAVLAAPPVNWRPMLAALRALPELNAARTVLLFCGVGREPDTAELLDALLAAGKTVALPRVLPGRAMEARAITGRGGLVPGPFAIPEPGANCPVLARDALDFILIPNLCCDRAGVRLGRGGGYYDRYLAGFAGFTAALCPEALLRGALPREGTDVPVRCVLSESAIYRP